MKLLSTLLLLPCLAPAAQAQEEEASFSEPQVLDMALVIINDSILTTSMLDRQVRRLLVANPGISVPEANSHALTSGVRKILFEETFQQLGFDEGLLDPQINLRIEQMILEDGSRASLEEALLRDGYQSIEEFRLDLRDSFVQNTVAGVLGGRIPSPNQGIRTLAAPTPTEIRHAYDTEEGFRHRPSSLQWSRLTFHNLRGKRNHHVRAEEVIRGLEDGSLTTAQALKLADKETTNTSISPNQRTDIIEFLENAAEGDTMNLSVPSGNSAMVLVVLGRTEAQDFTFEEAQLTITNALTAQNQDKAVMAALSELYQGSYVWVNSEIPGLEDSLEHTFGGGKSSSESEEL
ncbi:MAG: hypothetical protein ACPG31_11210 [Planctomycetota bacterium]